uniref:AlNc14C71G4867 protein n=1 Tax=Albugo laibachii Nc14 TaxID=890382 RepID=F0WE00_9STRA|nr:AlNc14C71G4867 [Albugo laibachii Nc14]|eukprot:CCA19429.1 AlNc14C71G4867 [Albugo laibachii Nc14]
MDMSTKGLCNFRLDATIEESTARLTLTHQINANKFAFERTDVQWIFGFNGEVVSEEISNPPSKCIPELVYIEFIVADYVIENNRHACIIDKFEYREDKLVEVQIIVNEIEKIYDMRHQLPNLKDCRKWQASISIRLLHEMKLENRQTLRKDALEISARLLKPMYTYPVGALESPDGEDLKISDGKFQIRSNVTDITIPTGEGVKTHARRRFITSADKYVEPLVGKTKAYSNSGRSLFPFIDQLVNIFKKMIGGKEIQQSEEENDSLIAEKDPHFISEKESYSPDHRYSSNPLQYHIWVVVMDMIEPMETYYLMSYVLNEIPSHTYLIIALKHADLKNWLYYFRLDVDLKRVYGSDHKDASNPKTSELMGPSMKSQIKRLNFKTSYIQDEDGGC